MANTAIEKLNSSNYRNQSYDIKYILLDKNLRYIIEYSVEETVNEKATAEEVEIFKVRANHALSIIYLNIYAEFKRLIEDCKNPVEAWKKLRSNYCPDSRSHHMKIFTDPIKCKIKPNESINLYSARLSRTTSDINRC